MASTCRVRLVAQATGCAAGGLQVSQLEEEQPRVVERQARSVHDAQATKDHGAARRTSIERLAELAVSSQNTSKV